MSSGKKHQKKKGKNKDKKDKKKHKISQSFDALNYAFGKTPKWRKKELAAKKKREKKRNELIQSIKLIGDDNDEFNEDVFDSLFNDKKDDNNDVDMMDNNDNTLKKKKKRKRLSQKKRKLLFESTEQSISKKRKLNDDDYKDKDFEDQGIMIKTVHSKQNKMDNKPSKNNINTNSSTNNQQKDAMIDKKKEIISQIHRFELTELMVTGIPRDYDEKKLNNYLLNLCSIECCDIHLFHNLTDDTKTGKAILSFISPSHCAIGYKYLFQKQLKLNHVLTVKPISNRYDNKQINHNKKIEATKNNNNFFDDDENENKNNDKNSNNYKSKVIKMSNLHWKTTENDIIDFFKSIGYEPIKIDIHITSDGYSNGVGKVEFADYKRINIVINKLNDKVLLNRNIKLEKAVSKEIFAMNGKEFKDKTFQIAIFNISQEIEEDDLSEFIKKEIGSEYEPIDIHLIHHLELFTTGYAFCKFKSFDITNKVVEILNNKVLGDRALRVIWSKPSKKYKLRKELAGNTKILSFTNLRYDILEKDIKEFIKKEFDFKIHKIEIFENGKGFHYGMAKIWLSSYEYAMDVVNKLNHKLLKGRCVNINYWEQRDDKKLKKKRKTRKRSKSPNKWNNKNKNKKSKQNKNNLEWNDDWFKRNIDGNINNTNNSKKRDIKVPQRLLDQLL